MPAVVEIAQQQPANAGAPLCCRQLGRQCQRGVEGFERLRRLALPLEGLAKIDQGLDMVRILRQQRTIECHRFIEPILDLAQIGEVERDLAAGRGEPARSLEGGLGARDIASFKQRHAQIELRRGEVAGDGDGLAIERDRRVAPALRRLGDAEIVEGCDIVRLERQRGAVALGRVVEPAGDAQGLAQIVVIGRHAVIDRDRGADQVDRRLDLADLERQCARLLLAGTACQAASGGTSAASFPRASARPMRPTTLRHFYFLFCEDIVQFVLDLTIRKALDALPIRGCGDMQGAKAADPGG